jgi:hypothetical protein
MTDFGEDDKVAVRTVRGGYKQEKKEREGKRRGIQDTIPRGLPPPKAPPGGASKMD